MNEFPLEVPTEISFKEALDLTQSLLSQVASSQLQELEIKTVVSKLVKSQNGARGFFVTYLTSDLPIADRPPNSIVEALRSHPKTVAELLVKNIAMSAAQAAYHRRNHAAEIAQGSVRVQQRTKHLIKLVNLPAVYQRAQSFFDTAATGEGSYKEFIDSWGYDIEQRQVICQALQQVLSDAK